MEYQLLILYAKLSKLMWTLCTLFKLIWEAIAGDTRLITPPPSRVGSNQQPSTLTGQAMVMDQNHNIPDCPTF